MNIFSSSPGVQCGGPVTRASWSVLTYLQILFTFPQMVWISRCSQPWLYTSVCSCALYYTFFSLFFGISQLITQAFAGTDQQKQRFSLENWGVQSPYLRGLSFVVCAHAKHWDKTLHTQLNEWTIPLSRPVYKSAWECRQLASSPFLPWAIEGGSAFHSVWSYNMKVTSVFSRLHPLWLLLVGQKPSRIKSILHWFCLVPSTPTTINKSISTPCTATVSCVMMHCRGPYMHLNDTA